MKLPYIGPIESIFEGTWNPKGSIWGAQWNPLIVVGGWNPLKFFFNSLFGELKKINKWKNCYMKSNVSLVIQGVHFCLQQLLTCMKIGTDSTVCKTKTNAPLVHTLHTRMQSLVKKEWVSESKKWKWPFWRISLASEPLGFQNLHKVISHNTSDNKHW